MVDKTNDNTAKAAAEDATARNALAGGRGNEDGAQPKITSPAKLTIEIDGKAENEIVDAIRSVIEKVEPTTTIGDATRRLRKALEDAHVSFTRKGLPADLPRAVMHAAVLRIGRVKMLPEPNRKPAEGARATTIGARGPAVGATLPRPVPGARNVQRAKTSDVKKANDAAAAADTPKK